MEKFNRDGKKTYRLTESQLVKVVKESLRKVLNESEGTEISLSDCHELEHYIFEKTKITVEVRPSRTGGVVICADREYDGSLNRRSYREIDKCMDEFGMYRTFRDFDGYLYSMARNEWEINFQRRSINKEYGTEFTYKGERKNISDLAKNRTKRGLGF